MSPVNTYVFIDLETTGMPEFELNRTKITELSMVAVKREHILDTRPGAQPRVQHKLTLCFNPRKLINPDCTKVSGLCNDLLQYESPLNDDAFIMINTFLKHLEKPVCLIAQNGLRFDFPILKNHLLKLNVEFPDDLMCADCYHAFYDILESDQNSRNGSNIEKSIYEDMSLTKMEVTNGSIHKENMYTLNSFDTSESMQAINETTPKRPITSNNILVKKKISPVCRRLPFGDDSKPTDSYKLKNIYRRILNRSDIEAHRAENDCIMTLEIAVALQNKFVNWVDVNQCNFSDIKPMRPGFSLGM